MKQFQSGIYINHEFHKSFKPSELSRDWHVEDMSVVELLSEASRIIGKLDMFSEYVPNVDLYIKMHIAHEATQSSKIEGTQTHFGEVIKDRDDIPSDRRDDWQEVQNYIKALNFGIEELKNLPLCGRLICNTHRFLMQGVRGEHKMPGEFRRSQNWIGGASINDASFVPPHQDYVQELMGDLDKFMNAQDNLPPLLKIALIHYQFETIHPFLDGNGRVGRLMIPLYLIEKKILKQPILYISDFFERNRTVYYDKLSAVREKNDINGWMKFFLVAIIKTAEHGIDAFDKILKLKEHTNATIRQMGRRSGNARILMDVLYKFPIITVEKAMTECELSKPTVYNIFKDMLKYDILMKVGKDYIFMDYIRIFSPQYSARD